MEIIELIKVIILGIVEVLLNGYQLVVLDI